MFVSVDTVIAPWALASAGPAAPGSRLHLLPLRGSLASALLQPGGIASSSEFKTSTSRCLNRVPLSTLFHPPLSDQADSPIKKTVQNLPISARDCPLPTILAKTKPQHSIGRGAKLTRDHPDWSLPQAPNDQPASCNHLDCIFRRRPSARTASPLPSGFAWTSQPFACLAARAPHPRLWSRRWWTVEGPACSEPPRCHHTTSHPPNLPGRGFSGQWGGLPRDVAHVRGSRAMLIPRSGFGAASASGFCVLWLFALDSIGE
jgi:hypothetical protein